MKKFLRIHRCLKHSESAEKVYSAIIRLFPRAFVNIRLLSLPLCLPWKLTMKKGFSTIRLQALRKVLISGGAQSIKYKSSQCEISSTNQFSHKGKRNARIAKLRIFCFKAVQSTGVASSYFIVSWAQIIKIKMYVKLLKSKCMWVEMIKIKMYLKLLKSKCM